MPFPIRYSDRDRLDKIAAAAREVTASVKAAEKFLKDAGIMDENGELAELYREPQEIKGENTMTKEELLEKLQAMEKEADEKWYELHMKHAGEWHETNPADPMWYRKNTLTEVIELVKQLN